MIEAGIGDPTSQEGIEFCTERCPYEACIVFESKRVNVKREWRIGRAKELESDGVSIEDIAVSLGISKRTVERYLEK